MKQLYKKFNGKEYKKLFKDPSKIKKVITTERCRNCGKWDKNIKWCVGLNSPKCRCKNPNTKYINFIDFVDCKLFLDSYSK